MKRHRYLVAYDIRDPRRLHAVHRSLKGYGWSMQFSVFICDLDMAEVLELKGGIEDIIDRSVDSVAFIDVGLPDERGRGCFDFLGVAPVMPRAGLVIL